MGSFILLPAKWVFELAGGDQSSIFFDPVSYSGTNGLILGILLYYAFRSVMRQREGQNGVNGKPAQPRRVEAKAH
jgi:hypothetical protein